MKAVFTILLFLSLSILYLLPSIIGRKKKNATSIQVLNFFLGWTLIGWVVALIWATTKEDTNLKKCPKCTEEVKAEAQICRFCGFDFSPGPIMEPRPYSPVSTLKKVDSEVRDLAADYINRMSKKP